ncbi:MAG: hypothetical protein ACAI35_27365 [Candidatus Methylacidiphilales bacterium]|nr:hypothetical protein [Candidatus Methylacidiphilales bacterium]
MIPPVPALESAVVVVAVSCGFNFPAGLVYEIFLETPDLLHPFPAFLSIPLPRRGRRAVANVALKKFLTSPHLNGLLYEFRI